MPRSLRTVRTLPPSLSPTPPLPVRPPSHGAYTSRTYIRQLDRIPRVLHHPCRYILTLHTDNAHHQRLTALRAKHFPPKSNTLSAQVTLFSALPSIHLPRITADITSTVVKQAPFPIRTGAARRIARGVRIVAIVPEAWQMYEELKRRWQGFLSTQDRNFRAYYTIQNKGKKQDVRETLEEVKGFESEGMADGLVLWRYDIGCLRFERKFKFREERK